MSFDSPQEVAEFGIRLMEKNKISGIPGWKNKAKTLIKHFMPEAVWFYLIKRHMLHESLDRNT
jgi:short-subunit dehydrogenase